MSIVAISRGTYSGGEQVARAVSNRLGYRCVSREVIYEAAQRYDVPPEALMQSMERRPPLWDRMLGKRSAHLTFMRAALCEYALGGNLVYHGYVGHLLLPGITHVLRVRVIADADYRMAAVMQAQQLAHAEAVAYIGQVDKERRQWARSLFGVEWDDPLLYDLLVNVSRISLDAGCDLVVRAAALPEFAPTHSSLRAIRDLTISSRVSAALASDSRTQDSNLAVQAQEGVITLVGTTHSPIVIQAAPVIAQQVEGVQEVRSQVRLLHEGNPFVTNSPAQSLNRNG